MDGVVLTATNHLVWGDLATLGLTVLNLSDAFDPEKLSLSLKHGVQSATGERWVIGSPFLFGFSDVHGHPCFGRAPVDEEWGQPRSPLHLASAWLEITLPTQPFVDGHPHVVVVRGDGHPPHFQASPYGGVGQRLHGATNFGCGSRPDLRMCFGKWRRRTTWPSSSSCFPTVCGQWSTTGCSNLVSLHPRMELVAVLDFGWSIRFAVRGHWNDAPVWKDPWPKRSKPETAPF